MNLWRKYRCRVWIDVVFTLYLGITLLDWGFGWAVFAFTLITTFLALLWIMFVVKLLK